MKKIIAIFLLLTLIALPALGEAAENLPLDAPFSADLNGDGAAETITWRFTPDANDEDALTLEIANAAGETVLYRTPIVDGAALWLADFGGPALVATGERASGDGATLVLRYTPAGKVQEIMFNADDREKVSEEYYTPAGFGVLISMNADSITLESQADVLGSWQAQRTYLLNENGRFVFDDGLWVSAENPDDPESWRYPALTAAREIEFTDPDGEADTLQPGTKLLITATDKESVAWFVTQDGETGCLSIFPGYETDAFNYSVNGIPETTLFKFVPYIG